MVFGTANFKNKFDWNSTTSTLHSQFDLTTTSSETGRLHSLTNSPDGTRLFTITTNTANLIQYNLSTPWDASTTTLGGHTTLASGGATGISSENGLDWYTISPGTNRVYLHEATTPWDVTTINTVSTDSLDISPVTGGALDCFVTGKYLYISGSTRRLALYDISGGLSSGTLIWNVNTRTPLPDGTAQSLGISADGHNVIAGMAAGYINIAKIDNPHTTTPILNAERRDAIGGNNRGLAIDRLTGTRLLLIDISSGILYSYTLS